ncbi:tyrosine phosphatase-like protein, partial [Bisporella sp. PMI_857]
MSSLKTQYLVNYNLLLAISYTALLARILYHLLLASHSPSPYASTYAAAGSFAQKIQTAALLEVLHAGAGLVKAPLLPTFIQTVAKNLVLWQIVRPFAAAQQSPAYTLLLAAWSIGEIIRYTYFVFHLSDAVPPNLIWLRYSAFVVLYPIGIGSEMWLLLKAIGASENVWVTGVMWFEMALYPPGTYVLYSYMLHQRRKVL